MPAQANVRVKWRSGLGSDLSWSGDIFEWNRMQTILKNIAKSRRSRANSDHLGRKRTILIASGRSRVKSDHLGRKWPILIESGQSWSKMNDLDWQWTMWVENRQAWAPDLPRISIEKIKPNFCGNIRLYYLTPLEIVFLWSFESLSVLCVMSFSLLNSFI